ncbi:MAG: Phosphate-binding protein [Magnetococcales bacterium]|nr:Phosphate-binding protein [Magnetococcales bacterium]HIJ85404.1 phosphate ABC transporter substrate-binding protein [Magnetococcales bacterium]
MVTQTLFFRYVNFVVASLILVFFSNHAQGGQGGINRIHIKGSNAMIEVVQAWTKTYQTNNPGVFFEVHGGGSGNGIAAMINGHVDIAVTTRPLRERENRLISQRSGALPKTHVIGQDALSITVNKANPINGISMKQLARIFGKADGFSSWTDLGVEVPGCPDNTILRMSRKNSSGDYVYFRETVFEEHIHFHPALITIREASRLMERVAMSPCAIAFTSMATVTNDVKTLCIARDDAKGTACVPPTTHFTLKGLYPLARPLFFYTLDNHAPLVRPFVEWVMGGHGQEILRKSGFIALADNHTTPASPATDKP